MFSKKILCICFVLLTFSVNFYSQAYISGQVVDVIDGRTLLIETSRNSQLIFQLQHIEVPEAGQPLAEIVKEHLRQLALGKTVNIRSNGISEKIIVGQVLLQNMDLSQQMLRDGAAWFYYAGASNTDDYKAMEAAAKAEKRGIWGIEGLKPPRELRIEKETAERQKQEEEKRLNAQKTEQMIAETAKKKNVPQIGKNIQSISNFNDLDPNLVLEFDRLTNEGYVSSPMQRFVVSDDTNEVEVLLGFGYEFVGNTLPKEIEDFGIAVGSAFVGADFLRANEVTIYTNDGKKLKLGKPKSKLTVQNGQILEVLFYKIERAELIKLATDKNSSVRIGKYRRTLEKPALNVINILLRSSGKIENI